MTNEQIKELVHWFWESHRLEVEMNNALEKYDIAINYPFSVYIALGIIYGADIPRELSRQFNNCDSEADFEAFYYKWFLGGTSGEEA